MDVDDFNEEGDQDVAQEVLSMHLSKKTLLYALHVHVNQFEVHLDAITHRYKAIALLWLLATFVGVGFLFSSKYRGLQIDHLLMSSALCLFGIIGVTSLWYVDISTFQKFWAGFFVEGIKMENRYKFLLKIGATSLALNSVERRIKAHENLYVFANIILLISAGIALILFLTSAIWQIAVCFVTIACVFGIVKVMGKVGRELQGIITSTLAKKQSK